MVFGALLGYPAAVAIMAQVLPVSVPIVLGFLLLYFVLLGWLYVWMAAAGARERLREFRAFHGQCASCGYDLRATVGRCPECGQAIAPR